MIPTPDWDGVIREVDRTFVRTLRRNLTAAPLFTPHVVRDLGIQTVVWQKWPDDASPTTISMAIPGFSARSGKGPTSEKVDIPVLTRDAYWDQRQRKAAEYAGIDTIEADNHAFAMARDINDYLYLGFEDVPGILNHPDVLDVIADTGNNWTVANEAVQDLNFGLKSLGVAEHAGPVVLLTNPANEDLLGSFVTGTSVQLMEKIPGRVSNILYDKAVAADRFYLIETDPRNFDAIVPSEVGTIGRVNRITDSDPIIDDLKIRWMTAIVPRIRRGEGVLVGEIART